MIRSFRLRLALLSALLTGLALLLFGAGSCWLIREGKLQRQDSELRSYAEREVIHQRGSDEWRLEEARIAARLGLRDARDVLLLQHIEAQDTLYQSSQWPADWLPAQLPWPALGGPGAQVSVMPSLFPQAQAAELPPGLQRGGPPHYLPGPRPAAPPPWPPGPRPPRLAPPSPSPSPSPSDAGPAPQPSPPAEAVAVQGAVAPPAPVVALAQRLLDGKPWRLALARVEGAQLAVAVNAQAIDAEMRGIRNAFLLSLPLALLLTGMASWVFAGRALAPLDKLVRASRSVTAGGLDQRLVSEGEDREFVQLIEVFNRMLARLERSFKQAHRFSADAAHELKTPLAIVQGQLERAIHQAEDGSVMQAALTSILDEVRRLSVISRKLLLLSQADAGFLAILREPVDLSQLLHGLLEDSRMLAPQLQIDAQIQPDLVLQADASLLRQVLHNLISNAIKYNLPGGWMRIETARWSHNVEVRVSNASAGISQAHRARLFERFFRADQAHSRNVEGVGLGLSVSREIARAHGGDLSFKGESAGAVQFSLVLPV
jgi:signal transduction histidine kinase